MNGLCKSLGCLGALLKIYNYGNLVSYLNYGVNQSIQGLMLLCLIQQSLRMNKEENIRESHFSMTENKTDMTHLWAHL